MNTTLVIALVIPWLFWGITMGMLIAAGRSWINILLIPVGISLVILLIASLASARDAFWASLILHLFVLIMFLRSYAALKRSKENE